MPTLARVQEDLAGLSPVTLNPGNAMFAPCFGEMAPLEEAGADETEAVIRPLLEMRARALASRDFLYTPILAQHLIEEEIPRLVALLRAKQAAR